MNKFIAFVSLHPRGEGVTACIAALLVRLGYAGLAQRCAVYTAKDTKNSLKEQPLAHFFATPVEQTGLLSTLSNCRL